MVWWFGAENADELWARLAHQHEVLEADKRRRNERRLQCAGEAFAYGIVSLSVDISEHRVPGAVRRQARPRHLR